MAASLTACYCHCYLFYRATLYFLPLMELQGDSVYLGVQRDHCGQSDPEVADLQDAVEQRVVHVLDVALAVRHRATSNEVLPGPPTLSPPALYTANTLLVTNEVLPANDRREEHNHRYCPGHRNRTQHLDYTSPAFRIWLATKTRHVDMFSRFFLI